MIDRDLVWHELDIDNPPPLTEAQREELRRLAELDDSEIDTSDIPEMFRDPANPPRRFREMIEQRRRAWDARQAQATKTAAE